MRIDRAIVHRNHVRAWALALALGCLSLSANALGTSISKTSQPQFTVTGNKAVMTPKPALVSGSDFISEIKAVAAGKVEMSGSRLMPWATRAEEIAMAGWKAQTSSGTLAKNIVKGGASFGLSLVAGYGIGALLDYACVRLAGGAMVMSPGGAWEECVPVSQNPVLYLWGIGGTVYPVTDSGALQACKSWTPSVSAVRSNTPGEYTCLSNGQADGSVSWDWSCPDPAQPGGWRHAAGDRPCDVAQTNPHSPTGAWKPASEDRAIQKIAEAIPDSNSLPGAAREFIERGGEIELEPEPLTVTGPPAASTQKTEKITTTVDPTTGDRTDTKTTTETKDKYDYDRDKVTRTSETSETTCKTVTHADGSPGGSDCTADKPPATTTTTTDPKNPDDTDLCKLHPEILACKEIDTPDGEVPKGSKNLTYAPEDLWGGGSCPADKIATLHGRQYKVWDWQQTCGFVASYVRPVLLVLAAFGAFMMLVPGGRE